jgi:hypothetical protein
MDLQKDMENKLSNEDAIRLTPLIRALYLHQKVFAFKACDWEIYVHAEHLQNKWIDIGELRLRPLSSITDDEAVQIAKIQSDFFNCAGVKSKVIRETSNIRVVALNENGAFLFKQEINNVWALYISSIQYLYQKGFALPFYDSVTNTTITVEQQNSAGIIKLKS